MPTANQHCISSPPSPPGQDLSTAACCQVDNTRATEKAAASARKQADKEVEKHEKQREKERAKLEKQAEKENAQREKEV